MALTNTSQNTTNWVSGADNGPVWERQVVLREHKAEIHSRFQGEIGVWRKSGSLQGKRFECSIFQDNGYSQRNISRDYVSSFPRNQMSPKEFKWKPTRSFRTMYKSRISPRKLFFHEGFNSMESLNTPPRTEDRFFLEDSWPGLVARISLQETGDWQILPRHPEQSEITL